MSAPRESPPPEAPASTAGWRRRLAGPLEVLIALLVLVTVLSFASGWRWWFELLTHFRFHGLLAGVLGAVAAWILGRRKAAAVSFAMALVHGWYVAPLFLPVAPQVVSARSGEPPLRLLIVNVLTQNRNHEALLDAVEVETPDLLLLLETDRAWVRVLEARLPAYPHRLTRPRGDNFGIALFSRRPLTSAVVRRFGGVGLPSIEAELDFAGAPLHLIVTHTVPPMGTANVAARDAQLAGLATAARARGGSTVVAGDLNATSYAPVFRDLLQTSGLQDSSRGYGLQTTWPSKLPFWLRIGIDHCLHTEDLVVADRRVLAPIGSDHLPLVVDLRRR